MPHVASDRVSETKIYICIYIQRDARRRVRYIYVYMPCQIHICIYMYMCRASDRVSETICMYVCVPSQIYICMV